MTIPKIIATDLDGTFFNDSHSFNHDKLAKLLDYLDANNGHFIVATGNSRNVVDAVFAEFIGRFDYLIQNGAEIITKENRTLSLKTINPLHLETVKTVIQNSPLESGFGNIYTTSKNGYMLATDKGKGFNYQAAVEEFPELVFINSLNEIPDPVIKVIVNWPEAKAMSMVNELNIALDGAATVTTSGNGYIDVIAGGVNKAEGLKIFGEYYDVPFSDMAAFGDNLNDFEMLSEVGHPIAMINGHEKLLSQFELSVASNDDDGVLDTINSWM
ncbi:MAG: HAD-IIB family hydrolase [Lactobacillaceae bacterium]|jgi:Cof subfamily protein (haloacid dehalogenase superfamily)|nr:HAD-IIB family hydrolase [Lactobacillaceae bacterium]